MKAILVKYYGPTNTRGSRFKAIAEGGDKPFTHSMSYDYELGADRSAEKAAIELCEKMNWPTDGLVYGVLPNGDRVFCFPNSRAS